MSESEPKKSKDISAVMTDFMKFTRKINTLGKAVDYMLVDIMPKLFKDNIKKAYALSKKQLDFFMAHII
jgi:hypothetical protein